MSGEAGTMHAVNVAADGSLAWTSSPLPECAGNEVLIKVHASALNRADLLQRRGLYPPPPGASEILGLECAGTIAPGYGSAEWPEGSRVCALLPGGGYAEYAAVPREMLLPVPAGHSLEEAAAFPEAIYTAYLNLLVEGALQAGELCLVPAGAGGIGMAAIQLAKAFGAEVIATAGSMEKVEFCRALGADHAFCYRDEAVWEKIGLVCKDRGIDVVLDSIGAPNLDPYTALSAKGGRLVLIGLLGGHKAELNMSRVLVKNLRIIGSTLRNRPVDEKIALTRAVREHVMPLWQAGTFGIYVDSVFGVREAEAAHEYMRHNRNCGKIVLRVADTTA